MACEASIMQCVMANPTVAAVGAVAGFVIAKAMDMRNKNQNQFP